MNPLVQAGAWPWRRRCRVFLGLREVAGYYGNLCRGLQALGHPCTLALLGRNPHQRPEGDQQPAVRQARAAVRAYYRRQGRLDLLEAGLQILLLLLWALPRHQVFLMGAGSSFLGHHEWWLFRLLRRRVVHIFHGSDLRPPYLNGVLCQGPGALAPAALICEARRLRHLARRVERWAEAVVAHPPFAQFLSLPTFRFLAVGQPLPPVLPERATAPARAGLQLLHAPSHPEGKGTPVIRALIQELVSQGHPIVYRELCGVPHRQVMEALPGCDLVIDQCWSDTPMAGLAMEAACCGRPALVGTYSLECLRATHPDNELPPSIFCHPAEFAAQIRRLLADPAVGRRIGQAACDHIRIRYTPRRVAARLMLIAAGTAPRSWTFDPLQVSYFRGACIAESRLVEILRQVLAHPQAGDLGLDHRPDLRAALQRWLRGTAEL